MGELERLRLWQLWRYLPELGCEDAGLFLAHLAHDPQFLSARIEPCLRTIRPGGEPYISATYGTRETANCLQIFVWAPGATTPIHDHTSWGAYQCVAGRLLEERYARLDDGTQPSRARLRKEWEREWRREDGASTVLAYERGIHRVSNQSMRPAVSVHIYGPRLGVFDGRDYDPRRDSVCDRLELDAAPALTLLEEETSGQDIPTLVVR